MKRGEYLFLHIFSGKIIDMCILDQNKVIISHNWRGMFHSVKQIWRQYMCHRLH